MAQDVTLTRLGHAAVLIESGPTVVLVDPFLTGNPLATVGPDDVQPTTILVTHAHNDHVGDAVAISVRTGADIIATNELAIHLGRQGASTVPANLGGTVSFPGGTAKIVPAVHTSAYDTGEEFLAPGAAAGFIVRIGGRTIYLAGDTALFGDMSLIGTEDLDVAFLPIGGHYTMDANDAVKAVKLLAPRVVIPYHFDTFPPIAADAEGFAAAVAEETDAKAVILRPGESYQV